jgi:hypothetical protein
MLMYGVSLAEESKYIQTEEDLKLEKELREKYPVIYYEMGWNKEKNTDYAYYTDIQNNKIEEDNIKFPISLELKCENPTSNINTIGCLIVNLSKIVGANVDLFSYTDSFNNNREFDKDQKIDFLKNFNDSEAIYYYNIYKIEVKTDMSNGKSIAILDVGGVQDNLGHTLDILITVEVLSNNMYKLMSLSSKYQ